MAEEVTPSRKRGSGQKFFPTHNKSVNDFNGEDGLLNQDLSYDPNLMQIDMVMPLKKPKKIKKKKSLKKKKTTRA